MTSVLDPLPDKGWGVLRDVSFPVVLLLEGAGLIRVQATSQKDVWQARLTGAGRDWRRRLQ